MLFRSSGTLGVVDYYKIRNLQADTDMRRTIAGSAAAPAGGAAVAHGA